ncbi:MAG: Fis family transcriptional regulator [Betaproteobacteria bacterium]|nr:Fis family transcriptional regulator [Betaproteobacteria bacterium]
MNKRHLHNGQSEIAKSVERSLDDYFRRLDGEVPSGLYEMVIGHAERALISDVMKRTEGNQTHAAAMLGMNRNTLRSKIRLYEIK